jgi:hypothetical protein
MTRPQRLRFFLQPGANPVQWANKNLIEKIRLEIPVTHTKQKPGSISNRENSGTLESQNSGKCDHCPRQESVISAALPAYQQLKPSLPVCPSIVPSAQVTSKGGEIGV